jgi:azurin
MRAPISFIACALIAVLAHPTRMQAAPKAAAATPHVITLSATDQMRFDPATVEVKAGEPVKIVLKPTSAMPKMAMAHNFVMLKPGAKEQAFVDAAATAPPTYIPANLKAEALVSTGVAGGGETVMAAFKAPLKQGRYTFICTFPGHYVSGMKGVLVVK